MSAKTAEKKQQSREPKPELTPAQLITELRGLRGVAGWVPMHHVDALLAAHDAALVHENEILVGVVMGALAGAVATGLVLLLGQLL